MAPLQRGAVTKCFNYHPERMAARAESLFFKQDAQDGGGVSRSAERASEFRSSLAARSRALCATTADAVLSHEVSIVLKLLHTRCFLLSKLSIM